MIFDFQFIQDIINPCLFWSGEINDNFDTLFRVARSKINRQLIFKVLFQLRVFRKFHFNKGFVESAPANLKIDRSTAVIDLCACV